MRTWIPIGLLTALVLGVVVVFAVLARDKQQAQRRSTNEGGDVPYGIARVAEDITEVVIQGKNGTSVCKPQKGIIKLPVGEYRVHSWGIARTDDMGMRWEMRAALHPSRHAGFTVAPDKEISLLFGEPIYCTIKSSRNSSGYSFEQKLEGRHGEGITLSQNGSRPPAPRLRTRNRDGTYDRSVSFAYG